MQQNDSDRTGHRQHKIMMVKETVSVSGRSGAQSSVASTRW